MTNVTNLLRMERSVPTKVPEIIGQDLSKRLLRVALFGAAAATAVAVDRGMGMYERYRRSDQLQTIEFDNGADNTVYTLPGCRTDGHLVADRMHDVFKDDSNEVYVSYPEKGFALDGIKASLIEQRQQRLTENPDDKAKFYAISMGGMVLANLLQDEEFVNEFGPIDLILHDSSPGSSKDVRLPSRAAMTAARLGQLSRTLQLAGNAFMGMRGEKLLLKEQLNEDDFMRSFMLSGARTPFDLTWAQGKFMRDFPVTKLKPLSQDTATGRVMYVHSPHDDVVKTDPAIAAYAELYGGIEVVVDTNRPGGNHAGGTSFPGQVAQLLQEV